MSDLALNFPDKGIPRVEWCTKWQEEWLFMDLTSEFYLNMSEEECQLKYKNRKEAHIRGCTTKIPDYIVRGGSSMDQYSRITQENATRLLTSRKDISITALQQWWATGMDTMLLTLVSVHRFWHRCQLLWQMPSNLCTIPAFGRALPVAPCPEN